MRFFKYLLFSLLFSVNTSAQQTHYIYIQTGNKQAFYVKLNQKIFSSTASGYVILPKLIDGKYRLSIGFPGNEWPEQAIDVTISDKDEGLILKYFDSKVWGLFNLQTMNIDFATDVSVISKPEVETKTDAFSNTLAEVTNTPSIRQQDPVKEQLATTMAIISDTTKDIVKDAIQPDSITALAPTTHIRQVFTFLDSSGRSVIYAINDGNNNDSVRLFIPYDKIPGELPVANAIADSGWKPDPAANNPPAAKIEIEKPIISEIKVTDLNADKKNDYKVTVITPACTVNATIDDLTKLGKKMSAAVNDDDRLAVAKKAFKARCFTTEQVRNLCPLFSSDEAKYKFFDAAYNHVSDVENFKDLQSQLIDEYYLTRFKAMLR